MNLLLVGACVAAGGALGPAEAGASRVLHERLPRGGDLVAAYRAAGRREALCTLASAALFALVAAAWGDTWLLAALWWLVVVLVVMTVVDLEHYLIPNRLVFPSVAVAAGLLAAASALEGDVGRFGQAAAGALAFYLGLLVVHLVNPSGMGFGDVKLALLLGLYLGWSADGYGNALYLVLLAVLAASLAGSLVGVVLLVRRGRGAHYPFGPWLGLGALVVLVGAELA